MTSNAAKCSRSCTGVVIPAWCFPWKAYADPPPEPLPDGSSSELPHGVAADARGARRERARAGDAEQAASREGALAGVVGRVRAGRAGRVTG